MRARWPIALVSGDEVAVYGDRAYESNRRRRWLTSHGINDRIMHRSHKHQPELPHWQKRRNALIRPRRALVEKVFGTLKRSYGYSRVRYRGLGRNALEMWFKLMAYNLRRMTKWLIALPEPLCRSSPGGAATPGRAVGGLNRPGCGSVNFFSVLADQSKATPRVAQRSPAGGTLWHALESQCGGYSLFSDSLGRGRNRTGLWDRLYSVAPPGTPQPRGPTRGC